MSQAGITELRHKAGLKRGVKHLHDRPVQAFVQTRKMPGLNKARALYGTGRVVTAVGAGGAVAGTTNYIKDRRRRKSVFIKRDVPEEHHNLLMEGLEGQVDAISDRVKPKKHTPLKAHILTLGLGAAGATIGGKGAAKFTTHLPIRAIGGAAGASTTIPERNKINNHYKVRARKKAVKPSTKANVIEARPKSGADMRQARAAIVPVTKALTPGGRARLYGSSLSGYGALGRLRPPEANYGFRPRGKALPPRKPLVKLTPEEEAGRRERVMRGVNASNEVQRENRTGQHRALQAMQRYDNRPFNLEKMNDQSEVHVPGMLQATGRKRLRMLTPYEMKHAKGRVKKFDNGYTAEQARRQLKRKKHKLVADVASTGLGLGGLALLGASHHSSGLKAAHRASLARAAGTSAVLGGGVAGINGIQGIKISRNDIKAQEKVLKPVGKAFGVPRVPRVPGFRSSYLQTRRLRNGTLKAVRVNGGVTR